MYVSSANARRNFWVRTIAGITGDVAIGYALATACVWIIQSASLGLFLSFLAWIATILLSLLLSQYVVHPAVQFVLSDRKLDRGIDLLSSLTRTANELGIGAGSPAWSHLRRSAGRFAQSFAR